MLVVGPEGTVVLALGPELLFPKFDHLERDRTGRAKGRPGDFGCLGLPAIEANINGERGGH